jgi:hypothetical protein
MNKISFVAVCCGLLVLPCCRSKSPPAVTREQPVTAVSSSPASSAALAVVSPRSPAIPSASASPGEPPLEFASQPVSFTLTLINGSTSAYAFRIHALQGAFLVTHGDEMFRLEDDKLVPQPYAFEAEHPTQEFVHLSGRYPDALSGFALVGTAMQSQRGEWYSYDGEDVSGPIQHLVAEATESVPGSTWLQGSRLLYRNRAFTAVFAGKSAVLPQLAPSTRPNCESEFRLHAFAAGLDGSVVAVGPRCENDAELVAERWQAGKSAGQLLPLNGSGRLPDDAKLTVVLGTGKVAVILASGKGFAKTWRETSTGFHEVATPEPPEPHSLAVGVEGDVWLVSRSTPPSRPRALYFDGQKWSKVQLPSETELKQKLGKSDDPAPYWVRPNNFAIRGEKVYLAATVVSGNDRQVGCALLTPNRGAGAAPTPIESEVGPDGCTPQVVLFAVSKTTPSDYQFPATRDAVIGTPFAESAEFVEVLRAGQRTLVAKTKTLQAAHALAAHIRERIAGSRPAVACEPMPEVVRTVPMR